MLVYPYYDDIFFKELRIFMTKKLDNQLHWWERPVRMMRVDYAPDFSQVMKYDLDKLAKSRKEDWQINCEWIVGAPGFRDAGHTATFAAKGYKKYPGFENLDYLRSYTPIAHKHGIKVVTYINAHYYSRPFADLHLDWEQITCRGTSYGSESPLYGNGSTFCVNTPWREWLFGLIREAVKAGVDGIFLDGPVTFPDCCYCESCKAKFKAKYGADIPQEDWANPVWKNYVSFREDSMADFLRDASKAVHETNPEAMIFMNAGSWPPSGWRVARDLLKVEPYQQINGAESFFYYGSNPSLYGSAMAGKYLRAGKNPSVVFTHYMNGAWHYRLLPAGELSIALYQTASCNSNPWIALFNCAAEENKKGYEPVQKVFGFMADHEEYYMGTKSIADAAILFSSNTSHYYLSRHKEFLNQAGGKEENLVFTRNNQVTKNLIEKKKACERVLGESMSGYFAALTRAHIQFDVLLDSGINKEKLSKYKVLILPDASCLTDESAKAIKEYVSEGGCLLGSFEAGMYDEIGGQSDALLDVFGIEKVEGMFPVAYGDNYLTANEDHLGIKSGNLIERAPYIMKVKAAKDASTPEQIMNPTDGAYLPLKGVSEYPGMILNSYGKGSTAYFAEAIGPFCHTGITSAEDRVCGVLRKLCGELSIEVSAPRTVSVETYSKEDNNSLIVHLVNNTVDGRPVRDFIAVDDISFSIKLASEPKSVSVLRENENISSSYKNGTLTVNIPKLTNYEMVVIDL